MLPVNLFIVKHTQLLNMTKDIARKICYLLGRIDDQSECVKRARKMLSESGTDIDIISFKDYLGVDGDTMAKILDRLRKEASFDSISE